MEFSIWSCFVYNMEYGNDVVFNDIDPRSQDPIMQILVLAKEFEWAKERQQKLSCHLSGRANRSSVWTLDLSHD